MADDKPAPKVPEAKAYIEILDKDGEVQKVEIELQTSEGINPEGCAGPSRNPDENESLAEAGNSRAPQEGNSKVDEDQFKYWAEFSLAMISKQRAQNGQNKEVPLPSTPIYFIDLHVEKDRNVFEYEIHFVPEVHSRSDRFKLVDQALGHLNTTRVYNGDACLYLPSRYITDKQEFTGVIPNTNEQVKTVMTYKRKWKMQECIRLYNVLFKYIKRILQSDYDIGPSSQIFPGDVFAVRDLQDGLMVICMDTCYTKSQKKTTIYEILQEYEAAYPENFKEVAMRDLTGTIIWSEINDGTYYTIEGFAWDKTPRDTFVEDGNISTTFIDYYKRQYNIDIQHPGQPLLTSKVTTTIDGVKKENLVCLVPELSYISRLPRPLTLPINITMVEKNDGLSIKPIITDTVYDLLQECQEATSNFKDTAMKNIIGEVVLTEYNNKTRIIQDIDWYTTPRDAFIDQGNVLTPYINYYKLQYNIDIKDVGQPLLISKFKTEVDGVKQEKLLYLVPELCKLSGLCSRIREYKVHEDAIRSGKIGLALYTYLNKVRSSEKAQKVLAGWGLKMVTATKMVPPQEEFPEDEQ